MKRTRVKRDPEFKILEQAPRYASVQLWHRNEVINFFVVDYVGSKTNMNVFNFSVPCVRLK